MKRRRQWCLAPWGLFQLHSSLSTILGRKSVRTCERRYRRMTYCEMGVLGLMWMSFRAAGCVYQLTSTVPGANSTGLCLATINLLWSHLKPHPPRGSAALFLPRSHSISPLCSPALIFPFFLFSQHQFWLLLKLPTASPLSSPLCSFPSSNWPHPRTKSPSCQAARQDRGSCELERSEINKARTGWMIYPEKMRFVTRMGTVGHKSHHPGSLRGPCLLVVLIIVLAAASGTVDSL